MRGIITALGWPNTLSSRTKVVGLFAAVTVAYLIAFHLIRSRLGVQPLALHVAVWGCWFGWQGAVFGRRRAAAIEHYGHGVRAYRSIFWRDILFGASLCFAQLLSPVVVGVWSAPVRVDLTTTVIGGMILLGGGLLLLAALRTIGVDAAGFLYEYESREQDWVVARGVYSHLRHPLFVGGVLCSVGAAVALADAHSIQLAAVNVLIYPVYHRLEDNRLLSVFPVAYGEYRRQVGR